MEFLIVAVSIVAYGWGVLALWNGFERTQFQRSLSNRIVLSLLWPLLFVANKSYRRNFQKALKGR